MQRANSLGPVLKAFQAPCAQVLRLELREPQGFRVCCLCLAECVGEKLAQLGDRLWVEHVEGFGTS